MRVLAIWWFCRIRAVHRKPKLAKSRYWHCRLCDSTVIEPITAGWFGQ